MRSTRAAPRASYDAASNSAGRSRGAPTASRCRVDAAWMTARRCHAQACRPRDVDFVIEHQAHGGVRPASAPAARVRRISCTGCTARRAGRDRRRPRSTRFDSAHVAAPLRRRRARHELHRKTERSIAERVVAHPRSRASAAGSDLRTRAGSRRARRPCRRSARTSARSARCLMPLRAAKARKSATIPAKTFWRSRPGPSC